eukprot:783938-Rhodomonas_salina.1
MSEVKVPPYALPTRCPVLADGTMLRRCYAMSGTAGRYNMLQRCYAVSGTELGVVAPVRRTR